MGIQNIVLNLLLLFSAFSIKAESIAGAEESNRGYFDRPYLRYEAEPGMCQTNGTFLPSTYDQRELQIEASNRMALQLKEKDSYVQWTTEEEADGLTLRFSLPDSNDGKGMQGTLALYADNQFVQNIALNSWWAWQYILKSGSKYPDNQPNGSIKFPRMRFDEIHLKLNKKISAGSTFKLVKTDADTITCTIDFAELELIPEPVSFESIKDENKVSYSPDQGKLQTFIAQNKGKTIYIPEGVYDVDGRIIISGDGTKIIGAGMWHTELFFSASSDERSTYSQRGIETFNSNILIEGLYLNTINNKRYYDNNVIYQVGKGFMGSFGSNSTIRNVWAEHFECGGWIEGADNLKIQYCRFRNNYADGFNLSYGSKNSIVEHCSFRNNGDDDMASWSRADRLCENNTFRYCTSENNWRASGLGFFGGKQNKAHNIIIADPLEAGFRITSDFPGMPFSNEGYTEFYNISVYNGGVGNGVPGINGDLWGNRQGALHINSTTQYDIQNIKIQNIDLYNSKSDAIFIGSGTKSIKNLVLSNIIVHGAERYGIYFYNTKGNGFYCNVSFEDIGAATDTNEVPSTFTFTEDCSIVSAPVIPSHDINISIYNNILQLTGKINTSVAVFDIWGRKHFHASIDEGQTLTTRLKSGTYIVRWNNLQSQKVVVH